MRVARVVFGMIVTGFAAGACALSGQPSRMSDAPGFEMELSAAAGRDIAVRECSSCHAIDQEMSSPRKDAPPMRTLLSRYDPEMLAEDLIDGIRVGHDDMPHFDFNVTAADSLIAYLKSIDRDRIE